ncbi:hypothetical protein Q9966_009332 [Columba livia]|nr:hypothetical protein Q9966_009332 [Columba livia]
MKPKFCLTQCLDLQEESIKFLGKQKWKKHHMHYMNCKVGSRSLCEQKVSRKMADDIDIEAMLEAPYKKGEMCDRGDIKLLQAFNENERRSREWHRSQEIHSGWLLA